MVRRERIGWLPISCRWCGQFHVEELTLVFHVEQTRDTDRLRASPGGLPKPADGGFQRKTIEPNLSNE